MSELVSEINICTSNSNMFDEFAPAQSHCSVNEQTSKYNESVCYAHDLDNLFNSHQLIDFFNPICITAEENFSDKFQRDNNVPNLADLFKDDLSSQSYASQFQDLVIKGIPFIFLAGQALYLVSAAAICPKVLVASTALTLIKDQLPHGDFLDQIGQTSLGICMGGYMFNSMESIKILPNFAKYIAIKPVNDFAIGTSFDSVKSFFKSSESPKTLELPKDGVYELGKDFIKRSAKFPVKERSNLGAGLVGMTVSLSIDHASGNKEITPLKVSNAVVDTSFKYIPCITLFPLYTKTVPQAIGMEMCMKTYFYVKDKIVSLTTSDQEVI